MGRHQYIGDTVVQVTIPHEGRVIEIELKSGKTVFEFNNRISARFNGNVANAEWLTEEYFDEDPASYSCDG